MPLLMKNRVLNTNVFDSFLWVFTFEIKIKNRNIDSNSSGMLFYSLRNTSVELLDYVLMLFFMNVRQE